MATKKGVKKKEHERLEDSNIEKVISLLEATPPVSKKDACAILNISYNTTRLANIIEEYKDKKERRKNNFARTRGTPLADHEKSTIVTSYVQGHPISDISEYTYRSASIIKRFLEEVGVPSKPKGDEYYEFSLLPEECIITERPKLKDLLWSSKYHALCEVMGFYANSDGTESIKIWVFEPVEGVVKAGFYAYQQQYELGSLKHLEKYLDVKRLIS